VKALAWKLNRLAPRISAGDTGLRAVDDMVSPPPEVYYKARMENRESGIARFPMLG
jgi:hypothetical protein